MSKKMFYSSIAELPLFEQFEKSKEKLIQQLKEENDEKEEITPNNHNPKKLNVVDGDSKNNEGIDNLPTDGNPRKKQCKC